ncbi:hypothetical protein FE257_010608 [Aspergillus nanangensis]|uniref:Uncharacterized protein n=1 Tax=Aspergillus nanangensis TaxID=2582783 RepID=A0AAD4GRW1_ASPNN|nr:hypothetical protein FE257_010608 [Aspergillus nanangensis]
MERPQSSGIDLTAFSFAKPLQPGKSFSLQCSNRPPSGDISRRENFSLGEKATAHDSHTSSQAQQRRRVIPNLGKSEKVVPSPKSSTLAPQGSTRPESMGNNPERLNTAAHMDYESTVHDQNPVETQKHDAAAIQFFWPESRVSDKATAAPTTRILESDACERTQVLSTPQTHASKYPTNKHRDTGTKRSCFLEQPASSERPINEDSVSILDPMGDGINGRRVGKRRRTDTRKAIPDPNGFTSNGNGYQPTEENLLQILSVRIKEREEKEIAALTLTKQMELNVLQLSEENKALRSQLTILGSQLQKKAANMKCYRSQMDAWKRKLAGFKGVLNELGSQYQSIREEAIHVKASTTSLDHERAEIVVEISDVKDTLAIHLNKMEQTRIDISKSHALIDSMKQVLLDAEERNSSLQKHLCEEKRRCAGLEAYIRETSVAQTKRLDSFQASQLNITNIIDAGFESMSTRLENMLATTQTASKNAFEHCLDSITRISGDYTVDKMELQKCRQVFEEVAFRMDTVAHSLTEETRASSEHNRSITSELQAHLQSIRESLGGDSVLFGQLSTNEKACNCLQHELKTLASCVDDFISTVESLTNREAIFTDKIASLEGRISDLMIAKEREIQEAKTTAFAEQAASHDKIQLLSTELAATGDELQAKNLEIEELKNTLLEGTTKVLESESRAQLSEEKAEGLQERVRSIELDIREELSRASVIARDQHKARFEQQLHELTREKAEAGKMVDELNRKLNEVQNSLTERGIIWGKRESELECLLSERRAQIEVFEKSCAEYVIQLTDKDSEIRQHQEKDSGSALCQQLLQDQLKTANEKVFRLEGELSDLSDSARTWAEDSRQKLAVLEDNLLKEKNEYLKVKKALSESNSALSDVEAVKLKTKSEVHELLRRLQESEGWLKKIRESLAEHGVSSPTQPFAETWSKLEVFLKSANMEEFLATKLPSRTNPVQLSVAPSCQPMPATPQKHPGTPGQEVFQTTKLFYRKQTVHSSPFKSKTKTDRLDFVTDILARLPASENPPNIVPFSRIRQQLPLASCSSSQDDSHLTEMLIMTPEEKETGDECSNAPVACADDNAVPPSASKLSHEGITAEVPSTQGGNEKQDFQCNQEPSATTPEDPMGTGSPSKGKAVTFQMEDPGATCGDKDKASNGIEDKAFQKPTITKKPARTYSKVGQSSVSNLQKMGQKASISDEAKENRCATSQPSKNKKAKPSAVPAGQKPSVSSNLGRKAGPASVASGSSQQSPIIEAQTGTYLRAPGKRGGAARRRSRALGLKEGPE